MSYVEYDPSPRFAAGDSELDPLPFPVTSGTAEGVAPSDPNEVSEELLQLADTLNLLFALQGAQQHTALENGKNQVEINAEKMDAYFKQIQDAIQAQRAAEEDKSFWDEIAGVAADIGKVIAVAAAVCSVVASGGLSLPAALALGGLVVSVGGGALANELGWCDELKIGIQIAGAVLGISGGIAMWLGAGVQATGTLAETAAEVAPWLTLVGGGTKCAEGGARIKSGAAEAESTHCAADQHEFGARRERIQRFQTQLFSDLNALNETFQNTKEYLIAAQNEYSRSLELATSYGSTS
jgi:hypothetical protein